MTTDDSSMGAAPGWGDAGAEVSTGHTFARVMRPSGEHRAAPRVATLVSTIEAEIVPRMMLARRGTAEAAGAAGVPVDVPEPRDLDELTRLLLDHEVGVAKSYVDAVRARGVPLDSLCLALLAPAARRLGAMWEDDTADFATVTVGLCHLHEVLRQLGRAARVEAVVRSPVNSVLLAPVPGEQHTFGLLMVGEFFRRGGWAVVIDYPATNSQLLEMVGAERYSVIGLTVGCREQLDGLSSRVAQIRRASRNRGIGVMLGGRPFTDQPDLAGRLGADTTAADARAATVRAEELVRLVG
jgi:methanogenic corrinoid protein MtbC1